MRISKFLLTICATALCANFISARAEDNPAQAAARAALMEKMNEMDSPPARTATNATATEPAPVIMTSPGATVEQPASSTTNMEGVPAPAPTVTGEATPEPATAAAPVMTNAVATEPVLPMTNVEATPAPVPAVAPEVTNAVIVEPAPPVTNAETISEPVPATIPATTNAVIIEPASPITNLEAATEPAPAMTNILILAATNPAIVTGSSVLHIQPDAVGVAKSKEKPAKVKAPEPVKTLPAKNPAFQPVEAPPLPISGSKQAQLEALLEKYKADQVTPAEYQAERAKILAEP